MKQGTVTILILIYSSSDLSSDPAIVVIHLGLYYNAALYSPFQTKLLRVTHGITTGCQPDHSLSFEFSDALEIFGKRQDSNWVNVS